MKLTEVHLIASSPTSVCERACSQICTSGRGSCDADFVFNRKFPIFVLTNDVLRYASGPIFVRLGGVLDQYTFSRAT